MATKLSSAVAPCGVSIIVLALLLTVQPSSSYAQQTVSESSDTEVSQAEQHFRLGVTLYKDGNFREALDEFNRALALDPDLEKATRYKDNTQEQLNVSATGEDPTARPTFESFDPESIGPLEESPQLSPEEHKIQKVRELVELAEQYLEFQFYDRAVEHFEQVLLIAPDNRRARKGLHEATLGAYRDETKEHQGTIREQTQRMRTEIEKMKLLPEGADSFGIRNPRIDVPKIEERVQQVEERSYIEEILENPVGVVFEDIHLQDILDFITDTYEVNIIVDNRVVDPPRDPQAQQGPGQGAPPGQRPGQRPGQLQNRGGGGGGFGGGIAGAIGSGQGPRGQGGQAQGEIMTDGMISYINLKNVTLREALKAILRPLNLDYSVQRSFIWISTAEKIRVESFETLETRFYELQNAGAETLFKIVLVNQGGLGSTLVNTPFGGGTGGGGGGTGGGGGLGGGGGGGLGGGGGGGTGGGGGLGGGGGGGLGGGGGGQGGGGQGGGGQRGGGQGGGGQGGGGQGGGGQGSSFSNISDLFQTINDIEVGEFPNPFSTGQGGGIQGAGGGGGGGTGAFGGGQQGQQGNEFFGGPGPGLGAQAGFVGEPTAIQIIRSLIPPVIEPLSRRLLSFMRYNILTNALVVHTSPANHKRLEALLKDLDATPKQVAIEAKFLTISVNDFDKVGFNWNFSVSDLNNRSRDIPGVTGTLTSVDLDGDGVPEVIPNNINPDGSNVIDNTISTVSLLTGLVSPMSRFADDNFSLTAGIISNADGDMLSVTFDFLDSLGESELLSSPRITTMNQKPAVIADVVSEFFLTNVSNSTLVISSGGIGGFSDTPVSTFQTQTFTEFITGITLSVTPQISGNQVRLWLNPQVTTIKDTKTFVVTSSVLGSDTSGIITLPTIATQAVWTNVIVNDGDTLVLGGTVSDITNKQEDRFPFLSDIPVFGFFFRGKLREVKQSSLLIFVTPNIIDSTGARYFESNL